MAVENTNGQPPLTDILKAIHFETSEEIAKKSTGEKIAQTIYRLQTGQPNNLNFFTARAARWEELERWSLGKQDMTQFLPYMNIVDANKSYAKIDMTPPAIGAQFVGTKVESIAKTEEYPCVTAIDGDSIDEKANRMMEAIFRMKEVETINMAQQAAGIQLEPSHAYVPDDEISARVYFELEDRLPKEIKFEKLLSDTLIKNDYNRVLKPRFLRDNVVFNFECSKVERVYGRRYSMRRCIPKNVFYNCFLSDTGKSEIAYIGEAYNLKVKDIRDKWGASEENPNGLTEQQLYDFARMSTQNNPARPAGFNYQFTQQQSQFNGTTPWDDFSGYVIDFEIEVTESDYYVSKIDSYGKENIAPKKGIPKPTSETAVIKKKNKKRWYRGVYAPYANMMIYWGKPDLTILDYTDTETSFCSYSVNIPNNTGEYVPSLFERALEPLKSLVLAKLKQKLLLGKLSPAQYRVDVEGVRDIVDGTGKVYDWEEVVRIKDATGVELYSSKGLDPLTQGSPVFSAATSDPTLSNIIGLQEVIDRIEASIRVLLGVPIYLDGSDVGQRTAAKLAEGQTEGSFNVTGFVANGHNQMMSETLNKICILYWQDAVSDAPESSNDLINTRFQTSVKMKITDYERQLLEQDIQRYSQVVDASGNPAITPKDAMMLRNITDYKLARWYLATTYEENRKKAIDDSLKLQKQNGEEQRLSLEAKAKNDAVALDAKLSSEKEMAEFLSTKKKEEFLLQGFLAAAAKDESGQLIKIFMPAIQQLVPNIQIPLAVSNEKIKEEISNVMQQQETIPNEEEQQMQSEPVMQ